MEKVVRSIVVQQSDYVYWYTLGDECTTIYLSPKTDKTVKVCVEFHNDTGIPHEDGAFFWRLTKIRARRGRESEEIELLMPGFIARLIETVTNENPGLFQVRNKVTRFQNAYSILERMGYSALEPLWYASLW